mgnify:CR=1 FL=1
MINPKIKLKFIQDEFDAELVQKESDEWRNKQGFATTSVFENLQIAGDKVFGFISNKEDIKVHKTNCKDSIILQSNYANRLISAIWVDSSEQEFSVRLKLSGMDTLGLVNEVTKIISSNMSVNIKQINFNTKEGLFLSLIHI